MSLIRVWRGYVMIRILLVEDKPSSRRYLKDLLKSFDYLVDEAADFQTAYSKIDNRTYDVVLLDMKLPDGEGIDLFDTHREKLIGKTIIITADATVPGVVDAIKKGAFNYLEKPVDDDLLVSQVRQVFRMNRLKESHSSLKREMLQDFTLEKIIYESKAMEQVVTMARVLAGTDNSILIQGETGTGKEILARAIHNASLRNKEIFLPINCAAIPHELFESELFGFEKGAFTGAAENYAGRFVQADKGTLFMDEIGELPIHIQAKLLRVLDEHVIYRLKSHKPMNVNVRLLAATNRRLEDEIKLKQFRGDLYYRLMESSITLPPLRERPEDIIPLTRYYLDIFNRLFDRSVTRLSREVETFFLEYSWDGNVRELKNTLKSIIPFKKNDIIEIGDLSYSVLKNKEVKERRFISLAAFEKKYIYDVLKISDFNIKRAAEILEITRSRLYRKIKILELEALVK
ncbi:MAG: sigma-54-dependent Fis family transcriptional regulator [bacterium]|nr:sigma-54-dependent Fis family transcriptional regulator [bacterium]